MRVRVERRGTLTKGSPYTMTVGNHVDKWGEDGECKGGAFGARESLELLDRLVTGCNTLLSLSSEKKKHAHFQDAHYSQ